MTDAELKPIADRATWLRQKARNHGQNAKHERQQAKTSRGEAMALDALLLANQGKAGKWVSVGQVKLRPGVQYFIKRTFGTWSQLQPCFARWGHADGTGSGWFPTVGTLEAPPKGTAATQDHSARQDIVIWQLDTKA